MSKFLEKTAEYLVTKYGDGTSDLCIVLPNRRGALFLKKYLSAKIGKTIWSPLMISIEDFMMELSGLKLCENTRLLFELFEIHKSIEGAEAQSFEEFCNWGQQLLHDFNEVDSYLADPAQIFGYLTEARVLSVWNLDEKPLTDFQKKYLKFYDSLFIYYQKLSSALLASSEAYPGLLFRKSAEKIESVQGSLPYIKIIFTGFNALTRSEEVIIDVLYKAGKAEMIWDTDSYYLRDELHEAGDFLRKWIGKWPSGDMRWEDTSFRDDPKQITITGIPFNIGQVKYCGEILSKIPGLETNPEETAVVLPDEQLLIPLLNSLPERIKSLNITMGLSLRQSTLYSLFETLFRMQENLQRFRQSSIGGKYHFYFRDVLDVLQNPYLRYLAESILQGNSFALEEVIALVRSRGRIFLEKDEIIRNNTGLFAQQLGFLDTLFSRWENPAEALIALKNIIAAIRDALIQNKKVEDDKPGTRDIAIEMEFLYGFSKVIFQVDNLMKKYNSIKSVITLKQVFTRLAETTSLPFSGEPLRGIQVMGMLETRTLDFENVILLSANEDLIPGGKTTHSFIPYDIRKDFHLPTYQHKNSVYGYHFYRLLQRAHNIYLVYNTEPDELGGGEKSRFIKQIEHELKQYNPSVTITSKILSTSPVTGQAIPAISIPKGDEVYDLLLKKAGKGLAPTSINNWRHCRLQFYFSQIAGLEEPEEPEETIDAQMLGQAVHEVLHKLYHPYAAQVLTKEAIQAMVPQIEPLMDKAFEEGFSAADRAFGQNLLMVKMATIMVRNFLREEEKKIENLEQEGKMITVKFLEQYLERNLTITANGKDIVVKLKGFADRVDQLTGNDWLLIDYKTGSVEEKELKIKDWEDLRIMPAMDKGFQLLMYAWLLNGRIGKNAASLKAGIISLKKVRSGFLPVAAPDGAPENIGSNEVMNEFQNILISILKDIFDQEIPFDQTEDLDICSRCPYITLCGR